MNPYISDDVTRVGRWPLRKLGVNDRLIRPATLYMDVTGKEPTHLATVIAATLQYTNTEDEEAVRLQKKIKEVGYGEALQNIADLDAEHPLIDRKSTRLNSSHVAISYAVFCLKKKKKKTQYI